MKEETIEKTVEVADKAIDVAEKGLDILGGKMVEYLSGVENIIAQYGGDAANLALNVLRIEAAGGAIQTTLFLVLAYPLFLILMKVGEKEIEDTGDAGYTMIIGGPLAGLYLFVAIGSASLWHWVGMIYPEMYAVHKFIM